MPNSSTVEVHLDTERADVVRNGNNLCLRDNGPIQRILKGDNFSRGTDKMQFKSNEPWKVYERTYK